MIFTVDIIRNVKDNSVRKKKDGKRQGLVFLEGFLGDFRELLVGSLGVQEASLGVQVASLGVLEAFLVLLEVFLGLLEVFLGLMEVFLVLLEVSTVQVITPCVFFMIVNIKRCCMPLR